MFTLGRPLLPIRASKRSSVIDPPKAQPVTQPNIPSPPEDPTDDHALPFFDQTTELKIEYCPTVRINADPKNPRTHPQAQINQIAASIKEFGFTNPILVDETSTIIAGHGRLIAAMKLKLATVPVIVLAHLSAPQKKALRLADNKIALNAGWDKTLLAVELQSLLETSIELDVSITGFSSAEIDSILAVPASAEDEVIPEPPAPRTQAGDIWILGDHRVGCGDCRDAAFLKKVMGEGVVADAAFLDPPYNVQIDGHANVKSHHREFAMASGEMTEQQFTDFLRETLGACAQVSKAGAVHFVCMDWRHIDELSDAAGNVYADLLNLCIWNKSNGGMGSLYRSKHELVFVYRVKGAGHYNAVELGKNGRNRTNVWDYTSVNTFGARQDDLALHPTVKPVVMVADAIRDVTRRGEVVLDAFLGSGTTLIAAEREGRRFRGLDIDPLYVDIAVQRWVAMTGREPILEPGSSSAIAQEIAA